MANIAISQTQTYLQLIRVDFAAVRPNRSSSCGVHPQGGRTGTRGGTCFGRWFFICRWSSRSSTTTARNNDPAGGGAPQLFCSLRTILGRMIADLLAVQQQLAPAQRQGLRLFLKVLLYRHDKIFQYLYLRLLFRTSKTAVYYKMHHKFKFHRARTSWGSCHVEQDHCRKVYLPCRNGTRASSTCTHVPLLRGQWQRIFFLSICSFNSKSSCFSCNSCIPWKLTIFPIRFLHDKHRTCSMFCMTNWMRTMVNFQGISCSFTSVSSFNFLSCSYFTVSYALQKYRTRINALHISLAWEIKFVMQIFLGNKICNAKICICTSTILLHRIWIPSPSCAGYPPKPSRWFPTRTFSSRKLLHALQKCPRTKYVLHIYKFE